MRNSKSNLLLGTARVDDEDDAVDGERRLGDVRRHDDLAASGAVRPLAGRRLEDALLKVGRQCRVERYALRLAHFRSQVLDLALYPLARLLDLLGNSIKNSI